MSDKDDDLSLEMDLDEFIEKYVHSDLGEQNVLRNSDQKTGIEEAEELGLSPDEKRHEEAKGAWHKIVIYGLRLVAVCLAFMFVVRVWHLITPWVWLSEDQLTKLNDLLFGGFIGTIIGKQIDTIISR